MNHKRPSLIFRESNLIKVVANNTKNIFIFDNDDYLFNKLNNKCFEEIGGYLKYYRNYGQYFAHHLVIPKKEGYQTDHINRDTRDNRSCNLRYVTPSENSFNNKLRSNNTSGVAGVRWNKRAKKWAVRITKDGNYIHLGYFDNKDDAVRARLNAEEVFFAGIRYKKNLDEGGLL